MCKGMFQDDFYESLHEAPSSYLTVVHNGIIENYLELREELQSEGYVFLFQTDIEIVVHLVDENILIIIVSQPGETTYTL